MASISSPGLGSGLDVSGIITKLMQVESQPLTRLTQQEASYQAKLTAFGSVKGALSSLQTASQTLKSTSTFTGKSASVSDSSVLSATSTSTASAGSYDISITTLAKNHIVHSSGTYGLTDGFNGGTLAFQIGSDGGSGGTTKSVTIPNSSTLSQVRDAINAGDVGVSASIVNDGTTNRLVLSSTTTGSAGNIRITATQSGTGNTQNISDFDYAGVDGTMLQDRAADNAVFSVNGLDITRSSNTVTDAIDGVTLSLSKEASTAKVTVAANSAAATSAVDSFVKAYNDAVTQLKTLTAYDATNKKSSILTGDSTARNIQAQLSAMVQTNVSGITGGVTRLSNIGITVQKDGTLATNSSTLAAALADPGKDVAALFTQTTTGNKGIAVQFNDLLESIVGTSGLILGRTEGLDASIKSVQKRADAMNLRLTQIESRYRRQFTSLDSLISSMQQTSQYLTQQLASLPSTSSS
jgi:flagellar hook-associated protein 2